MSAPPVLSPEYAYQLYRKSEIAKCRNSISKSVLSAIETAAYALIARKEQLSFVELLIGYEIDELIRKRCLVPSYAGWRRKRLPPMRLLPL